MIYSDIKFPMKSSRPFFYTNFVSTLDGKIKVINGKPGYYPIGSDKDFEGFIELRAHADAIIQGRNTASQFDTGASLSKEEFKLLRRSLGNDKPLYYIVVTGNPDQLLIDQLRSYQRELTIIVTTEEATIPEGTENIATVVRLGQGKVDLKKFSDYLFKKGIKNAYMEGGPYLLTSFLMEKLIDELFLTIAPKIYGNSLNETLTMVEGYLFPIEDVLSWKLLSIKQIEDEVFLRYASN